MSGFEKRLQRLEKQNRQLRVVVFAIGALMLLGVATGMVEPFRTGMVEVVNENGEGRAWLQLDEEGNGIVAVQDVAGNAAVLNATGIEYVKASGQIQEENRPQKPSEPNISMPEKEKQPPQKPAAPPSKPGSSESKKPNSPAQPSGPTAPAGKCPVVGQFMCPDGTCVKDKLLCKAPEPPANKPAPSQSEGPKCARGMIECPDGSCEKSPKLCK